MILMLVSCGKKEEFSLPYDVSLDMTYEDMIRKFGKEYEVAQNQDSVSYTYDHFFENISFHFENKKLSTIIVYSSYKLFISGITEIASLTSRNLEEYVKEWANIYYVNYHRTIADHLSLFGKHCNLITYSADKNLISRSYIKDNILIKQENDVTPFDERYFLILIKLAE